VDREQLFAERLLEVNWLEERALSISLRFEPSDSEVAFRVENKGSYIPPEES
jgi:hypothetical protein